MADEKRYCEDCRFYQDRLDQSLARCSKAMPQFGGDHMVARALDLPDYCSRQRTDAAKCGPDAKWFEPKTAEKVAS